MRGTITLKFLSFTTKTFKNDQGEEITFSQVNTYEDDRIISFVVDKKVNTKVFTDIKQNQEITLDFEYRTQRKKYEVEIDGKTKSIWVSKPKLVIID